jgi:hypothetical protein
MPRWDVADRHELSVAAPADRTYRAVRTVDLAASPVSRLLFAIRSLPAIARGRRVPPSVTLDDAVRMGFALLSEQPGREIVLGTVGRFWVLAGADRSRVVTETRVLCADAAARRSFLRYWRVIRPGSAITRRVALGRIKRAAESP